VNVVGAKWVFRLKRKADGSIERYKAHLVAKGFHQQPGIDFGGTYSPVVMPIAIRIVISLVVSVEWEIKQIDVSAFLYGFLQEFVYMVQSPGFIDLNAPSTVCHLKKAIYGLKQAPRAWFQHLNSKLFDLGFHGSQFDSSLFIFSNGSVRLFVLVYVDDIILTSFSPTAINGLIQQLPTEFLIKDLGKLNFFLRVEVSQSTARIHLY
jgi:hypothetical protein